MKRLLARLELIEATGVLGVDVGWVNGNYQRILAHGCNLGLYTMEKVAPDIAYRRLKYVNWRLVEENQRGRARRHRPRHLPPRRRRPPGATARRRPATGSASPCRRKVLQRTYSTRFNDFALGFYFFVADNYAPF